MKDKKSLSFKTAVVQDLDCRHYAIVAIMQRFLTSWPFFSPFLYSDWL